MNGAQLGAYARAHRTELAGAGAGVVALYALYRRHKANTAAATGGDPSISAPDPANGAGDLGASANVGGAYGSTGYDIYDSLEQQLTALQGQIAGLTPASTTTPAPTPTPPWTATPMPPVLGTNLGRSPFPARSPVAPSPVPRPVVRTPVVPIR